MWIQFLIASVVAAVVVILPGIGPIKVIGLPWAESLCLAPTVSVALIALLCVFYGELGIFAGWQTVLLPLCALSAAFLAFALVRSRRSGSASSRNEGEDDVHLDPRVLFLYLSVALVISTWFFVRTLNGPSSFSQEHDNLHHLLVIKGFLATGDFSTLHVNTYATRLLQGTPTPVGASGSFYPAAWYDIVALVASAVRCDVAMAQNATTWMFLTLVLPLASYIFLSWLFSDDRVALISGSVLTLSFSAFPWQLLIFGTLYPNFGGYCLILAVSFAFIRLVESSCKCHKVMYLCTFLLGGISLGLMHPNAVFSTALLLFPYCLFKIQEVASARMQKKGGSLVRQWIPTILFAALFAGVWVVLYKAPALQGVTSFSWEPFSSVRGQLLNVLLLSFKSGHAQTLLGVIVLLGLACSVRDTR
ncbi:MAG: hypothetical protein IKE22_00625, partial [Atopobiaceae bacterium]|nr:hypothetical protein [Atopobiaceae bacterium]